ncbi:MAG: HlyD family secretion protein, partial [Candidatus Binatia bacterium]
MQRKVLVVAALVVAVGAAAAFLRFDRSARHYTGFVEGEERILRSEVSGRILEVRYAEGAAVAPNEVVAVLDDEDVRARLRAKQEEVSVLDAELLTQEERIALVEVTWRRDVDGRAAEVRRAEAAADLAEKSLAREKELAETGASPAQRLDEARSQREQTHSLLAAAREALARAKAEERNIALARGQMEALRRRRELTLAQLAELEVTARKYSIRAPAVPTIVESRFAWPGELAQPGTP